MPLSDIDVTLRSVGWAVLALVGFSVVTVAAYTGVRVALDRSRSRRWAAEWDAVEPRWNRQVS
jgi:phage shock protein PspC (stress-responsive transcriptional regulator)